MSRLPDPYGFGSQARPAGETLGYESRVDSVTVAQFFNTVYAWMASGLALTAVVAWWVSTRPDIMRQIFQGPMLVVLLIAELGLVWIIAASIEKINASTATVLFLVYSALNGLTLSAIFLIYAHATLSIAFFITAGMFAAVSLYGYVTKRDLTSLGSILFMALIGLIIASVVNAFWHNPTMYWMISYVGVLIFVGLTAYDTQKLRYFAVQTGGNPALASRLAISGALILYLDFINLFLLLLRILGKERR
jgi:FtsH-binding integral membrane protein